MLKQLRRQLRGRTVLVLGVVCFSVFFAGQAWLALKINGAVSEHEQHHRHEERAHLASQENGGALSDSEGSVIDLVRRHEYGAALTLLKSADEADEGAVIELLQQHEHGAAMTLLKRMVNGVAGKGKGDGRDDLLGQHAVRSGVMLPTTMKTPDIKSYRVFRFQVEKLRGPTLPPCHPAHLLFCRRTRTLLLWTSEESSRRLELPSRRAQFADKLLPSNCRAEIPKPCPQRYITRYVCCHVFGGQRHTTWGAGRTPKCH